MNRMVKKIGQSSRFVSFLCIAFVSVLFLPVTLYAIPPVSAKNGMVVSQQYLATKAGLDVLREGGNAVDAAVTVGFVEAVTLPAAGNIGGGGFMLAHLAKDGRMIAIDFREKAPAKAYRDMFLDSNGDYNPQEAQYSYRSVGVPGTVAGLALALQKYGTISLARALRPAIDYAENGFRIDPSLRNSLIGSVKRLSASPASMAIFFKPNGSPYDIGDLLYQRDLAWSLKQIAKNGPDAFYKGEIAQKIAADMKAHDGFITMEDLAAYRPAERTPLHGTYREYDIWSMPPPSSGGVHLIQMLNILEGWPKGLFGHNTAETIRLLAETMKLAYADRSKYLGDPDFYHVPASGLISKEYAAELRKKINLEKITPSSQILPGSPGQYESDQTTHYSVVDKWGNAVSVTYTLNFSYGSGITVAGTGILLNDEMDDFSSKPGSPNAYGLLGNEANAVEPGKRMLSCMTPTIVMKNGAPYLVTGSPGGSLIITTVLQLILNVLDFDMNVADATNAVRIHHQWMPDELSFEKGLNPSVVQRLTEMGYVIGPSRTMGVTQSIMRVGDHWEGAADMRSGSSLAEGY